MAALTTHLSDDERWAEFKVQFKKSYGTPEEEEERKAIFVETLRFIEKHNSEGHSWTVGINHFADMKPEERQAYCGGRVPSDANRLPGNATQE